jgi:hypothetical protein
VGLLASSFVGLFFLFLTQSIVDVGVKIRMFILFVIITRRNLAASAGRTGLELIQTGYDIFRLELIFLNLRLLYKIIRRPFHSDG